MSLDIVFKVAGIGLLVGIFAMLLDQTSKREQAQLVAVAGVVVVLYIVVQAISQLFGLVKSVFQLY